MIIKIINIIWRPPSISKLTPTIFNMDLTHFDSVAFIYLELRNIKYDLENENPKIIIAIMIVLCLDSDHQQFS